MYSIAIPSLLENIGYEFLFRFRQREIHKGIKFCVNEFELKLAASQLQTRSFKFINAKFYTLSISSSSFIFTKIHSLYFLSVRYHKLHKQKWNLIGKRWKIMYVIDFQRLFYSNMLE